MPKEQRNYWIDEIHDVAYNNNFNVINGLDIIVRQVTFEHAVAIHKILKEVRDYG